MRDPRRQEDPGHVWEAQDVRVRRYHRERFDRLGYASRVLAVLRPARVDVTLFEGHKEIRVERGHAWRRAPGFLWATVSIPADATREEIALTLMDVAGVARGAYVLEALLALDEGA